MLAIILSIYIAVGFILYILSQFGEQDDSEDQWQVDLMIMFGWPIMLVYLILGIIQINKDG